MKYWKPLLVLVILIAGLAFAKIKFLTKETPPPMMAAAGPMKAAKVSGYVTVLSELDNAVYATGTLLPNEMVNISPEVGGKLTYLNITEGAFVSKGQLIAKVNDSDLQAQLKKLQVQLKIAEDKTDRAKKLVDLNGLSIDEYENALNALNVLKADMDYTKTLIAKTEIRAPFSGKMGFKNISEGAYVTPGQVLTTLEQTDPLKVEFSIPERYAPQTKNGSAISFKIDGYSNDFSAKVYAINPSIEANNRSVLLRAKAGNAGNQLKPGAFARIQLSLGKDPSALMVPTESIIPILKGQQVLTVKDGVVTPAKVVLGVRTDTKVQVLEGLLAGDTVITTGLMSLRPGAPVEIIKIVQ
jgi:membrane fusion protein (multidrug efflux system)